MKVYHHARIETYANDESQAKLTLVLETVMAIVIAAMIVAGAFATHACNA